MRDKRQWKKRVKKNETKRNNEKENKGRKVSGEPEGKSKEIRERAERERGERRYMNTFQYFCAILFPREHWNIYFSFFANYFFLFISVLQYINFNGKNCL